MAKQQLYFMAKGNSKLEVPPNEKVLGAGSDAAGCVVCSAVHGADAMVGRHLLVLCQLRTGLQSSLRTLIRCTSTCESLATLSDTAQTINSSEITCSCDVATSRTVQERPGTSLASLRGGRRAL
jgi:hypothetical protein